MYTIYYYPISSKSLAPIFGSACIYPAALYGSSGEDDQNRFSEVILLTSNFGCQDCDCCLEVIITEEGKDSLIDLHNGFFICVKPIPISRIRKIHFKEARQADWTITSIRLSTAFIPESIVDHSDNTFSSKNSSMAMLPPEFVANIDGLKKQQDEYDRILGALALMKVAHVAECNVSPHYVDVLSFFNTKIKEEKEKIGPIDSSLCAVFNNPNKNLRSAVTELTIEEAARKENQQVSKNKTTKVIDLNDLTGHAYLFAVLYTYGVESESRRKRIDELILNNFQEIKDGKGESVAFYYGYNRGYSILGNVYENERNKVVVKFPMESLLDYYIIESVYDYVVSHKCPGDFNIFDWVSPQKHRNAKKGEYIVIDTLIQDKKKIPLFSNEWWSTSLVKFLKKDDFTLLGIDITPTLTDIFIKPWTQFVSDEISAQFDEYKGRYEKSLSDAQLQIENQKKKIDEKIAYIEKLENQIEEVNKSKILEDPWQNNGNNDAINSLTEKIEIASKAIEYAQMAARDFKSAAKERGVSIPKGYDRTIIILKMLGLCRETDLFSESK